ncbi:MAG: FhaA domain-containing protein [Acidimicrobiales bacterium]
MGLQQFERRLERLVEGVFARAFRSGLQPVEIGRRLTREMDLQRTLAPRGTLTPNHFVVTLSPEDADRFAPIEDELVHELVSVARDHAGREDYVFIGPVNVTLEVDEHLHEGMLEVRGEMTREGGGASVVLGDGRRVELDGGAATIGRLPECTIVLADGNVSRRHAKIRQADGGWVIVDLGSTNGTRLNGFPVTAPRELNPGDEITVGNSVLRFESA